MRTHLGVRIYDWMEGHRCWCLLSLLASTLVLLALVSRLEFREDIADFLPLDGERQELLSLYQEAAGANRIVVVLEGSDSADSLTEVVDRFVAELEARDTTRMVRSIIDQADVSLAEQTAQFVYDNIPYFLEESDYCRMDSLLAADGYMPRRLQEDREMLMLPGGLLSSSVEHDPLGLFTPVTEALRQASANSRFKLYNGYIFTPDMQRAIVMVESSFGNSETKGNARLVTLLRECADSLNTYHSSLTTHFIGGPVTAVDNASQIKADSILSISIAVALILALLYYAFRRWRHLLLIAIAIGWGWLFALAALSLVHREVSIIVIGISSLILGIAVNYPLHLISHLRHAPDIRQALHEIARPLVVGNVTTVGAFLALVPLRSVALRDLGLFSAFLLIGTILFVLLWMPHLLRKNGKVNSERLRVGAIAGMNFSLFPFPFSLITILTLFFGYHSLNVSFDTDLTHINYISDEQKAGMAMLDSVRISPCKSDAQTNPCKSDARFVLADSIQQQRLAQWRAWTGEHRDQLMARLGTEARRADIVEGTFEAFSRILTADYAPQPLTYFRQLPPSLLLQNIDVKELNSTMLNSLTDHFNYIGWVCSLIVFCFLWLSFRSLLLAVIAFLPMAVGWVWILGIMSLCGIQFNIVNIILATFIFGQGDDYTIFMTEGAVYETLHRRPMLASYRQAIILSALIMFIGIGSLIVARHPALHSLAEVTIVGMASVVLMALLLPPVLFSWYVRYRRKLCIKR